MKKDLLEKALEKAKIYYDDRYEDNRSFRPGYKEQMKILNAPNNIELSYVVGMDKPGFRDFCWRIKISCGGVGMYRVYGNSIKEVFANSDIFFNRPKPERNYKLEARNREVKKWYNELCHSVKAVNYSNY